MISSNDIATDGIVVPKLVPTNNKTEQNRLAPNKIKLITTFVCFNERKDKQTLAKYK